MYEFFSTRPDKFIIISLYISGCLSGVGLILIPYFLQYYEHISVGFGTLLWQVSYKCKVNTILIQNTYLLSAILEVIYCGNLCKNLTSMTKSENQRHIYFSIFASYLLFFCTFARVAMPSKCLYMISISLQYDDGFKVTRFLESILFNIISISACAACPVYSYKIVKYTKGRYKKDNSWKSVACKLGTICGSIFLSSTAFLILLHMEIVNLNDHNFNLYMFVYVTPLFSIMNPIAISFKNIISDLISYLKDHLHKLCDK